ncbi:hypothetical protein J6590_008821 [Homalodisca vitripennis]|nr:hypothetical protein J6590_008821 [Homalodisca vitripennis]
MHPGRNLSSEGWRGPRFSTAGLTTAIADVWPAHVRSHDDLIADLMIVSSLPPRGPSCLSPASSHSKVQYEVRIEIIGMAAP